MSVPDHGARRPVIDAHLHVWDPARAAYDWLDEQFAPVNRTVTFDEVRPDLIAAGISATVLVQAADNADDLALMLATADAHPEVAAMVAWVPLDHPAEAAAMLADLAHDDRVVGIRNLIHNRADPDWLLGREVDRGLDLVEQAGLSFDVVSVLPRHLTHVPELARRHPDLRLVIDHLGHPPIGLRDREPWWSLLARAAAPNVTAKISGLYSVTPQPGAWTTEQLRPFVDRARDVFGADRLMYGGDWPVSVVGGGYARVWSALSSLIGELGAEDQDRILAGTATDVYRIAPRRLAAAAVAFARPD